MNKPCEYCGADLPEGVDKGTRRVRSFHFASCEKRPASEPEPYLDPKGDLLHLCNTVIRMSEQGGLPASVVREEARRLIAKHGY